MYKKVSMLLTGVMAVTMLFSAPAQPPAVSAADDTAVRLEIEDITEEQIVEDANVSGGKFQIYKAGVPDDVVQTFWYDAEEAGYYQISVACAPYVQGSSDFLSRMYVRANEGEYTELSSGSCNVTKLEALETADQTFNLSLYTCKTPIYLETGENRIDIKAVDRINAAGAVVFGLDYIELEKAEAPSAFPVGRIEIEDITDDQLVPDMNASGGEFQRFNGRPDGTTEDVIQSFLYDVEEAGYYQISVACAPYVQGSSDYLSRMFVRTNMGEYTELSTENCNVTKLPPFATADQTFNLWLYTCKTPVYLEGGENRIDIKAIERVNGPAAVVFGLDYVELEKAREETSVFPVGKAEIEAITEEQIKEDANVSGGKVQIYKDASSTDEVVQTFRFEIETGDEYEIAVACAANSETKPYLSPMSFRINGGEFISLNDENCRVEKLPAYAQSDNQEGTFGLFRYTYAQRVTLEPGIITLDVRAESRTADPPDVPSSGLFFALDFVEIQKADQEPDEPAQTEGRVEVEDITDVCIVSDANTSGGRFQMHKSTSTDEVVQRFSFTVKESGYYTVNIACGNYSNMSFLSQMFVSVNGGEEIELNKENCAVTKLESLASADSTGTYDLYSYVLNNEIHLEPGTVNVDVKAVARLNGGAGVYFALDYVEVKPLKELTGLICTTENGGLLINSSQPLVIHNAKGETITAADVTELHYSSDDSKIVSVDNEGMLYGRNYGKAVISVLLDRKGDTHTVSCPVYVTEKGLYLEQAERNAGTVTIRASALVDTPADAYVMIMVYGTNGKVLTSAKEIYTIPVEELAAGKSVTLRQEVNAGSTDKIGVYLIGSGDSSRAVYSKIIL